MSVIGDFRRETHSPFLNELRLILRGFSSNWSGICLGKHFICFNVHNAMSFTRKPNLNVVLVNNFQFFCTTDPPLFSCNRSVTCVIFTKTGFKPPYYGGFPIWWSKLGTGQFIRIKFSWTPR